MWEYARRLELLDSIAKKSRLSEREAGELDERVKKGILARYSRQK